MPRALLRSSGVRTAGCHSGLLRRRMAVAVLWPTDIRPPEMTPTMDSSAAFAKNPAARLALVYTRCGPELRSPGTTTLALAASAFVTGNRKHYTETC